MSYIRELVQSRGGQTLAALWLLTLACLLGFPAAGIYKGDFLGYTAFGFLLVAIVFNLSIIVAHFIDRGIQRIVKIVWVALCIAELAFVFIVVDPQHPNALRDAGTMLGYTMATLTFPLGFVGPLSMAVVGYQGTGNFYASNFIEWLSFFLVGYIQWFKLVPYLVTKLRGRKSE